MTTKLQVGAKSALRSLLPIILAMGTYLWGHWQDALHPDVLRDVLLAALVKGISSYLTAKPVNLSYLP